MIDEILKKVDTPYHEEGGELDKQAGEIPKENPYSPSKKIKEYQEKNNEKLKGTGLKIVNEKIYTFLWVSLVVLVVLFSISMIWGNALKSKFLDKDFSTNVVTNVLPANVTNQVNVEDKDTNNYEINNYYNQTLEVPNITIINIIGNST